MQVSPQFLNQIKKISNPNQLQACCRLHQSNTLYSLTEISFFPYTYLWKGAQSISNIVFSSALGSFALDRLNFGVLAIFPSALSKQ